jgi:hypothetical protein
MRYFFPITVGIFLNKLPDYNIEVPGKSTLKKSPHLNSNKNITRKKYLNKKVSDAYIIVLANDIDKSVGYQYSGYFLIILI